MNPEFDLSRFVSYLELKKAVDDRSLNPRVWASLARAVAAHAAPGALRVLELACGIGTMLERLVERGLFRPPVARSAGTDPRLRTAPARIEYTGVDASPGLIDAARRRLPDWAGRLGLAPPADGGETWLDGRLALCIHWEAADAFDLSRQPDRVGSHDLLLAHAFLDLVDARRALGAFLPLLRPGGLYYFSLNFDGATIFRPQIDRALDARIERLYHQTMDRRVVGGRPSGHSQTGRKLFSLLPQAGAKILDVGSSDWVVPRRRGMYDSGDRQFLAHILETVGAALHGHPELDPADLQSWLTRRQTQLGRRELTYIAHQLDFFGVYAPPG